MLVLSTVARSSRELNRQTYIPFHDDSLKVHHVISRAKNQLGGRRERPPTPTLPARLRFVELQEIWSSSDRLLPLLVTLKSSAGISSVLGESNRAVLIVMDLCAKEEFVVLVVRQSFDDNMGLKRKRQERTCWVGWKTRNDSLTQSVRG